MARALRHDPARFGLALDESGWTSVEALAAALRVPVSDVEAAVALPGKRRYEIEAGRVRARYGHSVETRVEQVAARPPGTLFHGTTADAVEAILRDGLLPMGRQYVHLSADVETARQVGGRRRRAVAVLTVAAGVAAREGVTFYDAGRGVWLADAVPARYLSRSSVVSIPDPPTPIGGTS
jgi:putative RNA 2'-phosphotransferase